MAVVTDERPMTPPIEHDAGAERSDGVGPMCVSADEQILQALGELRADVSALRSEVLGQNQQMLSRIQFLHEGLIGRIKQMREQGTPVRRRPGR
jgi:hypothetical protein